MAIKSLQNSFFSYSKVMHKRLKKRENGFVYNVFNICFDVTKTDSLKSKLFSVNKFNIFSFYNKDHGNRDSSSLESWIRNILAEDGINENVKKIYLFTYPRILGYVFNPVSFWFCLNKNDELIAVLSEVNNTFGESHSYLIKNQDLSPIKSDQYFDSKKEFHVSPFFKVRGDYKFRFIFTAEKIAVWIDYFDSKKALLTSVVTKNLYLSDSQLIKAFIKIPLMTFKVIFLIHYEALKLVIKRIKYVPKPSQLKTRITKNNQIQH